MKNADFSICLFGESAADGCTAEQSSAADSDVTGDGQNGASVPDGISDEIKSQNDGQTTGKAFVSVSDFAGQIADAIGIDAADEAEILSQIRRAKARGEIEERLRMKNAVGEYEKLISEADRLSETVDGFDLTKEMQDRRFAGLLSLGLSMEEAYNALHHAELLERAVENARSEAGKNAIAEYIRNSERAFENGLSSQSALQTKINIENLTGRSIRDILRRVEKGAKVKF